jgi:hypothetical protein
MVAKTSPILVARLVTFDPVSSLPPITWPPLIPPPPNTSDQHEG